MGRSDGKKERNAKMYGRRKDGITLAAIAGEFDLSRETVRLTVRQMVRKAMWRAIERNSQREYLAPLRPQQDGGLTQASPVIVSGPAIDSTRSTM
jgi:hypothetical protein